MSGTAFLLVAVFLASTVEMVEATTIVLAVGTTRGWRSTMFGVLAALAALAVTVAALGPALVHIPISALRLVVGGLLLVFGLGWLRKAILRAGGWKPLHDEEAIFATALERARQAGERGPRFDGYAFTICFKGVLLEGLEVVFIVLTFGSNQHDIPVASLGAAAAALVVLGAALAVRAPLARVPENTLKFAVGVLLTSFGTFWGAEGAGTRWPGGDAALLVLIPVISGAAVGLVTLLRARQVSAGSQPPGASPADLKTPVGASR
ncbi:MAG: COG4280 domain-containing protein [Mycobacteriales bacterium]